MAMTVAGGNHLLDRVLGSGTPSTVKVAVMLSRPTGNNPSEASLDEPSDSAYERVEVNNDAAMWPNAVDRIKSNGQEIIFPEAVEDWGSVKYFALLFGDLVLCWGTIAPRSVIAERVLRFEPESLTLAVR